MIRDYGILNTEVSPDDAFLYGIPFPGVYVCDADGVVVSKFFHDSYKKRDSPELLIDAALGRITLDDDGPSAQAGDPEVTVRATVHGGAGSLRQGIVRHVVVRFSLAPGLHLYGEPVPEGMIATQVDVEGPPGLVVGEARYPATETLHLAQADVDLQVFQGDLDVVVPIYPTGELASETRPKDRDSVGVEVRVRYQACNGDVCLLPRTETLRLDVPLDVVDMPGLAMHLGHGQREATWSGRSQLVRLFLRKVRQRPLGLFRFIAKNIRLERAARERRRTGEG